MTFEELASGEDRRDRDDRSGASLSAAERRQLFAESRLLLWKSETPAPRRAAALARFSPCSVEILATFPRLAAPLAAMRAGANYVFTKSPLPAAAESRAAQPGDGGRKTPKKRAGRPATLAPEERVRNLGICGKGEDLEYLRLFRSDDPTGAFRDVLDIARTYRPAGPHSGPASGRSTHAAKLLPGTRTMLRRELAEKDRQLDAARQEIETLRAKLEERKAN